MLGISNLNLLSLEILWDALASAFQVKFSCKLKLIEIPPLREFVHNAHCKSKSGVAVIIITILLITITIIITVTVTVTITIISTTMMELLQ